MTEITRPIGTTPYALAVALMFSLQLAPIWSVKYPALVDYPNHLARVEILHNYSSVPLYQARYEPAVQPIPNLGFDLVMSGLLAVAPLALAGKIFLSLTVLLFVAGCHMLSVAVHGRPGWTALAATFFTYNFCFSRGFLNYLLGLGIFFLALAVWMRGRPRWTPGRLAAVTALATAGYFSHLSSFVLLSVACAVLTVLDVVRAQRVAPRHLLGLLPLAPLIVLLAVSLVRMPASSPMLWWQPFLTKKLIGLAYPFVSYHVGLDLAVGGLFVLTLLLAARPLRCLDIRGDLTVVAAVFLLLYVVAPMQGWLYTQNVDRRLLVPACVLAVVAMRVSVSRTSGRLVLAALMALWTVRMSDVIWTWRSVDQGIARQATLLDGLPLGASVFPIFMADPVDLAARPYDLQFLHSVHYATIARRAFVPTLFQTSQGSPVRVKIEVSNPNELRAPADPAAVPWNAVVSQFDYIWAYKLTPEARRIVEAQATFVAEAGDTRVYRTSR